MLAREAAKREGYRLLDTALVGAVLAPDYMTVAVQDHGTGFGDRAKGIRSILEHRAGGAPIDSLSSDSTRVRIFGDVAIVTGVGAIHMRRANGPFVIRDLYTDVWHRRGGQWLLVHTQHDQVERQIGSRRYEPSWRLMGVSVPVLEAARGADADAAIARYRALKATARADWAFDQWQLNSVGYWFLRQQRPLDAIKVFALNVEEYPEDANAYDSLGEAYLAAADTTRAIANYRRSLQLDSTSVGVIEILKKITP